MSGHSKWATIKHKKGALDAKRGKAFTRLIKEITIAAKAGGDPDGNPRLRTAVAAAKAENMPADNIKRAIQRGTGELPGAIYEEITFEGYGPGGVAIIVETTTDNRNRTVSEIRHAFSKNGGNMGEQGSVSWMFERKSEIVIDGEKASEDQLMNLVLDAGAGTGAACRALKTRYPKARVLAVDSALGMLRGAAARRSWFRPFFKVVADAARLRKRVRPSMLHRIPHVAERVGALVHLKREKFLLQLRHRPIEHCAL